MNKIIIKKVNKDFGFGTILYILMIINSLLINNKK